MRKALTARRAGVTGAAAVAVVTALAARQAMGSDHQDTPEVEVSPRLDINDVYAFPGSTDGRIVLAVTTQSPITPAATGAARFDPDALYQIKIDNTGDAREDVVIQFQFEDDGSGGQRVAMFGPAAPVTVGMQNRVISEEPDLMGNINTVLSDGSGAGMVQLFAGPRDDPFYIDLEQFFRIVPDRRPAHGPLSTITQSATAFRPKNVATPGPFDATRGNAVDFVSGFNSMAIVVEVPEAMVKGAGNNIGIWATVSR